MEHPSSATVVRKDEKRNQEERIAKRGTCTERGRRAPLKKTETVECNGEGQGTKI